PGKPSDITHGRTLPGTRGASSRTTAAGPVHFRLLHTRTPRSRRLTLTVGSVHPVPLISRQSPGRLPGGFSGPDVTPDQERS
ncbi:hypothetical protein, partial [Streptomyces ipomoeae]|uniref:hypothetical protein n=1 Tax=Streptomyces ipomoeae TaxID=103232 RepID=UPI001C671D3E